MAGNFELGLLGKAAEGAQRGISLAVQLKQMQQEQRLRDLAEGRAEEMFPAQKQLLGAQAGGAAAEQGVLNSPLGELQGPIESTYGMAPGQLNGMDVRTAKTFGMAPVPSWKLMMMRRNMIQTIVNAAQFIYRTVRDPLQAQQQAERLLIQAKNDYLKPPYGQMIEPDDPHLMWLNKMIDDNQKNGVSAWKNLEDVGGAVSGQIGNEFGLGTGDNPFVGQTPPGSPEGTTVPSLPSRSQKIRGRGGPVPDVNGGTRGGAQGAVAPANRLRGAGSAGAPGGAAGETVPPLPSNQSTAGAAVVKPVPGESSSTRTMRLPGESPEQYLRRIGG